AANVIVGTSTPAPGVRPRASSARCRAAVHEFTATAWQAPTAVQKSCSNRATRGPVVNHPDCSVEITSYISSTRRSGLKKGTSRLLGGVATNVVVFMKGSLPPVPATAVKDAAAAASAVRRR